MLQITDPSAGGAVEKGEGANSRINWLTPIPDFWITECGYSQTKFGGNETNRFNQLSIFYRALGQYDRPKSAVGAVFHFVFSKAAYPSHAIWDHGVFYKSADIFKTPGAENTTWTNRLFDAWQVEHFGDQAHLDSVAGDSADFDNDGTSNLEEYNAGSNPNDANDSGRTLRFDASATTYTARTNDPQLSCTLLHTHELAPAPDWQPVTNAVPVSGADEGFQRFSTQPEDPAGFFRLRIDRTP